MSGLFSYTKISGKVFGAVAEGGDVRELDADSFRQLYDAFLEFGFLVIPNQHLTEAENIQFAERFGKLEFGALPLANEHKQKDGTFNQIISMDTQRMRTNVGNEAWHTDSTYWPISSKCAMLTAHTVPDTGGETELADTRDAYEDLSVEMKARIEHLSAFHSTQYSQANDVGDFPEQAEGTIYHGEAYLRPLVKVHPETGKKNLFIGRHAFGIPGLTRTESRSLLKELMDFVVSEPKRVYQHKWQEGDLLFWDNRALLHRACAYDYRQARVMIATRVAGDKESELAYYPEDPAAEAGRFALAQELEILRQEKGALRDRAIA